jgi:hypothetical protein
MLRFYGTGKLSNPRIQGEPGNQFLSFDLNMREYSNKQVLQLVVYCWCDLRKEKWVRARVESGFLVAVEADQVFEMAHPAGESVVYAFGIHALEVLSV